MDINKPIHNDATLRNDRYAIEGMSTIVKGSVTGDFKLADETFGVWSEEIKWLDGFWFGIEFEEQVYWLNNAHEYQVYSNRICLFFREENTELDISLEIMALSNHEWLIINMMLSNGKFSSLEAKIKWLLHSNIEAIEQEQTNKVFGRDKVTLKGDHFIIEDELNEASVVGGSTYPCIAQLEADEFFDQGKHANDGVSLIQVYPLWLDGGKQRELVFYVTGSEDGVEEALDNFIRLIRV